MATHASREEIKTQVKAVNTLHERVVDACWKKCVPKPRDDQLGVGEMSCIDRCVAKYLETQAIVKVELESARGKVPLPYP